MRRDDEPASLLDRKRVLKAVDLLPLEAVVRHVQQSLARAVGSYQVESHVFATIVHVRRQRVQDDVLVKGVALAHFVVFSSGWNLKEEVRKVNAVQRAFRWG